MRHENRYFFAHLFGFAGLTVDEILNNARAWWEWRELRGKHKAEEKEPSQTSHKTTTELSQQKENPPETEGEVEMSLF